MSSFKPSSRIILHIDFDSFFASVEQQDNPDLRNKPLGVTATNGRNCIIASSREAKLLGIKTGTRVPEAKLLCPSITLTPADFEKYWKVSKKFIAICKDYSPTVEVFSIDELYIDLTFSGHLFGGVKKVIQEIKERIYKEVGPYVTVSVGISHNKLLAKLASGLKKPNGEVTILPSQVEQIYSKSKLSDICGIGPRIEARLNSMGVFTLLQLRRTPLHPLIAEFGQVEGNFLYAVGKGEDTREVISYTNAPPVKSVSRHYCLEKNEYDRRLIQQHIYELCEEIGIKLRRLEKSAKTGGLSLRGTSEIKGYLSRDYYFNRGSDLFLICDEILRRNQNLYENGYIRQIAVWAGNLKNSMFTTLPLFPKERKKEKLTNVIDVINDKFGNHTIRNGFLLYSKKLTTVPNGFLADKYERTKLAQEI